MTPLARYVPVLAWLPRASGEGIVHDVVAGLAAAAVVIPQALAYASLAGLPVQYGLYVCFVPLLAYAALGTSRVLSVSTTSTISILTATAVAGRIDLLHRNEPVTNPVCRGYARLRGTASSDLDDSRRAC